MKRNWHVCWSFALTVAFVAVLTMSRGNVMADGFYNNMAAVELTHWWVESDNLSLVDAVGVACDGRLMLLDGRQERLLQAARPSFIAGMTTWAAGDCESAARIWKQLVQLQPKHAMAWFWLGIAQVSSGQLDLAAQSIRSAKAEELLASLAIKAYELHDKERARSWLTVAAKTGAAFPVVGAAVQNYYAVGARSDAIAILSQFSQALQPNTVESWQALGLLEKLSGNHKKAVQCFETALQMRPNDLELLSKLRVALIDIGDYEHALEIALREVEISANPAQKCLNMAWIYRLLEDYDNARLWAVRAQKADSNWWAVYYHLGMINCLDGHGVLALADFDMALQLNLGKADVLVARAECLYRMGYAAQAIQFAEEVLEKHDNDAKFVVLYLDLGQWYTDAEEIELAKQLYERGLQVWPQADRLQVRLDHLQ